MENKASFKECFVKWNDSFIILLSNWQVCRITYPYEINEWMNEWMIFTQEAPLTRQWFSGRSCIRSNWNKLGVNFEEGGNRSARRKPSKSGWDRLKLWYLIIHISYVECIWLQLNRQSCYHYWKQQCLQIGADSNHESENWLGMFMLIRLPTNI